MPPRPPSPRPPGERTTRLDLRGKIATAGAIALFEAIDGASADTLALSIDLEGGDAVPALGIFDALARRTRRVVVDIAGRASSGAALVAMAGDRRRISLTATVMLHRAAGGPPGWCAHFDRIAVEIAAAATGQPRGTVELWLFTGWTFGAEDALQAGLAHEIALPLSEPTQ